MIANPQRHQTIIVDDEPNAIEVIDQHLSKFRQFQVVGRFRNALDARRFLESHQVGVIFLDIHMPGLTGLDFLRTIEHPPAVFLTTAHRNYAPEAFELAVQDYLLKPISFERFSKAIEKYENRLAQLASAEPIAESQLIIRADRKDIRIACAQIMYLEALGDYVKIHLSDRNYLTKESLQSLSDRLPADYFKRIHRSYVVNIKMITASSNKLMEIGEVQLPISRSYR